MEINLPFTVAVYIHEYANIPANQYVQYGEMRYILHEDGPTNLYILPDINLHGGNGTAQIPSYLTTYMLH
jgi:hypothetical protein